MLKIDISVSGAEELSRKLTKLASANGSIDRVISIFAQKAFDEVYQGASRHTKEGMLARSLGTGPRKIANGYEIKHDLQIAPYASYVNFGTRPHRIGPRDKKALRWVNGGSFAFARFVNHPGYKGSNYVGEAVARITSNFDSIVAQHFKPFDD